MTRPAYMHVIDINDPYHPKEVARWSTRPDQMGNYVHDIAMRGRAGVPELLE